jgi:hypothetical protein
MLRQHQFSIRYLLLQLLLVGLALGLLRVSVTHHLYGFQNIVFVISVLLAGAALGGTLLSRILGAIGSFVFVYLVGCSFLLFG